MMEWPAPIEVNVGVCVKSEHSLGLEGVCIKSEPLWDEASVQDEPSCSDACVKDEPSCSDACVKDEPSSPEAADTCGVSEAAAAAAARLYADHVVKDELVIGPELVETRRVLCAAPASLSTAEWSAVVGRACCVRLEHMHVDLKRRTCRIGPHTYKLHLCLNSQRDTNDRKNTNISKDKISRRTRQKDPRGRPKAAYQCSQCSFTTARKASLESHERNHIDNERLDCDRCGYIASDKAMLKKHMRNHNRNRSYKNGRCSTSFLKSKLLVHEKTYTGKKPYKCGKCKYASTQKSNLKIHEQIHIRWRKAIKMWPMSLL